MEVLIEFAKILLPAALVLYAMYLGIKTMIGREITQKQLEVKQKSIEISLPIRLQAYERICLFLERITPSNLIIRVNDPGLSAPAFQQLLLKEIRDEYNHNVSQQVYMSVEAWEMVKTAKEDLIMDINSSMEGLNEESSSIDLAKSVFEHLMNKNIDPIDHALKTVKSEISRSF